MKMTAQARTFRAPGLPEPAQLLEPRSLHGVPLRIAGKTAVLGTILIVVLLLLLLGALPSWPHSRGWGYYPSGTFGLVLVIVVVLALLGRI
jgi:hypothetical protein